MKTIILKILVGISIPVWVAFWYCLLFKIDDKLNNYLYNLLGFTMVILMLSYPILAGVWVLS